MPNIVLRILANNIKCFPFEIKLDGDKWQGKIDNYLLSIFLYLFGIFLFIITILCLFYCFRSILEGNRRKELKQVENRQIWQKLCSKVFPGRSVNQGWSTIFDRDLARRRSPLALRKVLIFSFFGSIDIGQLGRSYSDLFGYLKTSKTHPQGIQNHSNLEIYERIKRRRSSCSQDSEFLHYFCNSLLVSSSTFFLVSF